MSARPPDTRHPLTLHPASPRSPVREVFVSLRRDGGRLALRYSVAGDMSAILVPAPGEPVRADNLWRHTCFEAFVRRGDSAEYVEYNFSPSGEWAAYHFSGYRADMRPHDMGPAAGVTTNRTADSLEMTATLDIAGLELPPGERTLLGVTAVIEDRTGGLSYWALKHPAGKPDFHHADSFVIDI